MMKRMIQMTALVLIMASTLTAHAQEKLYAVVEYMHVPEGQSQEEYVAMEKLQQRRHQKAVDAGTCRDWFLFRVENGGRHHYVTVRVYDSLDKMRMPRPDSAGLYNSEESALMRRAGQLRTLTHRDLWELQAAAMSVGDESKDPIQVHFMKAQPGKRWAYSEMERNLYQKIHRARVDAGQMKGWLFLSRMIPSGADSEFDFVTFNIFPKNAPAWDDKTAQAALTKEEWESMPDVGELRRMVREEVWHPLLRTGPKR